jgi:hypothetical protein
METGPVQHNRIFSGRRAPTLRLCGTQFWTRPILELRVPKTEIYVNNHSMKAREYGPRACQEKKRAFITLGKDVKYFISLVYTEFGLALATAFISGDQWLRDMKAKSTRVSP